MAKRDNTLHNPELTGKKVDAGTQQFLDISEIRDDVVVLRDGTMRAVLMVSSMNFALKSEDEQVGVIQGYISFLNSIDFPLQVVIQSRKLDISEYLGRLNKMRKGQKNELLKAQIVDYIKYITELVELADIMTKKFYAVVPYSPYSRKMKKSFIDGLSSAMFPARVVKLRGDKFEKYKEELFRRTGFVQSGLSSLGLKAVQLDTQSLIQLYYESYNPIASQVARMVEVQKLRVEPGSDADDA